jgi:tRNA threonylcarbamoyladenosine biosynthesis protein TsaE
MTEVVFSISNRDETDRFGQILAGLLEPTDVVGLTGDLGAGKTYLSGVVAHALGVPVETPVSSPTFTLIKEYHQGRLPIYHLDLYRLEASAELYELGLWEYYDGDGVCLVEWSNLFSDLWPERALVLEIGLGEDEARTITARGEGRGGELARQLETLWTKESG